jgi:subtilase family serine protease
MRCDARTTITHTGGHVSTSIRRRATIAAVAASALAAAAVTAGMAGATAPATADALPAVIPAVSGHINLAHVFRATKPPTTTQCQASFGVNCYGPLQYEKAYDLKTLYNHGNSGQGQTIAIVDAFGSPTIASDLHTFDQAYGLPDPNLSIIQPSGPVPAFDGNDATMQNWAFETTLDVEYAHAMAPGANILLAETPVAETEGSTGLPEMMDAVQYIVAHHLAAVVSQSYGATENTFANPQKDIPRLDYAFKAAASKGVTVLAASGDAGATDAQLDGTTDYPYRVNSWPSSDPLVTSVGGTMLSLNNAGNRLSPDVVWNDGYGAGGGGVSEVFSRPSYQAGLSKIVGSMRGTPDVSMSAAVNGGAIVYLSFPGYDAGYYIVGGTSEATPLFAGVVALAAQAAGHPLGQINPALYALAGQGYTNKTGLVDVTSGNNSFDHVHGYPAKTGYDLASGVGTVDGAKFVKALS